MPTYPGSSYLSAVQIAALQAQFDNIQTSFQRPCKLIYPPIFVACSNCQPTLAGGATITGSVYSTGGPISIPGSKLCSVCNGSQTMAQEVSEVIQLHVITKPASFYKIADLQNIRLPDGTIQVKGWYSDFGRLKRATQIIVDMDMEQLGPLRYRLYGEPTDMYSVIQGRYMVAFLERV